MVFLLALVFLTMMLRVRKDIQKHKPKKENKENQGQTTSNRVTAKKIWKITIYIMNDMNEQMMYAVMH